MKLNNKNSLDDISLDVSEQRKLKEAKERLQQFLHETPITIKYGCHTIRIRESRFDVLEVNEDGITIDTY